MKENLSCQMFPNELQKISKGEMNFVETHSGHSGKILHLFEVILRILNELEILIIKKKKEISFTQV